MCSLYGWGMHKRELISKLKYAQAQGYKTCLYTGEEIIDPPKIKKHLTWLKTGRWDFKKGGLDSPTTNQRFF